MILRRAVRDLKALGMRAVLVVLAIAMAAGTGGGASLTSTNVQGALDSFYSKYHLADIEMSLKKLQPQSALLARARRAGATRSSVRLLVPGSMTLNKSDAPALLVGMPAHPALDQLEVLQGKGVEALKKHGAVVEGGFRPRSSPPCRKSCNARSGGLLRSGDDRRDRSNAGFAFCEC